MATGNGPDDAERREREEMFTISPEILAGGALPRRSDGSAYRADFSRGRKAQQDAEAD